jgi:hypothetical protein
MAPGGMCCLYSYYMAFVNQSYVPCTKYIVHVAFKTRLAALGRARINTTSIDWPHIPKTIPPLRT